MNLSKEIIEDLNENSNNWIMTGVDFDARRIDCTGDVGESMQAFMIRSLLKLSELSKDPIEIYLSSYGGDVYAGLAIYDAIRACECDVSVIATGKVMSAGTLIFLAGDYRVASKNTRFMIHSVLTSSEGKVRDLDVDLSEAKFLNSRIIEIYAERTKVKNHKIWQKKLANHDVYFGLDKAIEYGMIREVSKGVPDVKSVRGPKKRIPKASRRAK